MISPLPNSREPGVRFASETQTDRCWQSAETSEIPRSPVGKRREDVFVITESSRPVSDLLQTDLDAEQKSREKTREREKVRERGNVNAPKTEKKPGRVASAHPTDDSSLLV